MKPPRKSSITEEVVLDAVRLYSIETVEAAAAEMFERLGPRRMVDEDAFQIRRMIKGWGRTSRVELRCPASWWQHLKFALRKRWPRLFGRLSVRFDTAVAENGAIVAGLAPVLSRHYVIPYMVPTGFGQILDDPTAEDEP